MKKLYGFLLLIICASVCYGQQTQQTGAQILRSARSIYDQGRLHELPTILEGPLNDPDKFSDNEKVEAYKILILTYIYIEEPEKADDAMIKLLNTNKFFSLSPADPIEFKNLYRKFRSDPLFRMGVRGGINQSYVNTLKTHYVSAEAAGNGEYKPTLGFQGALVFEKDLKGKFKKFVIAPELAFMISSINYENTTVYTVNFEQMNAFQNHTITYTNLQLNGLVQYKLVKMGENYDDKNKTLVPLVFAGPSVSYLLGSSFSGQNNVEQSQFSVSGTIDNTDNYRALAVSVIAGAGARLKLGGFYLVGDIRFQYGLMNVVNADNRNKMTESNRDLLFDYQYRDNDMKVSLVSGNLGLIIPIFKPIKLIK